MPWEPPPGWAQKWLGTEPRRGYGCAEFAAEVLARDFAISVALPSVAGAEAQEAAIAAGVAAGDVARPLGRGEAPIDGDGVLMRFRSDRRPHHLGLYVRTCGGPPAALHLSRAWGGARLSPLDCLPVGLRVVGLYRWLPPAEEAA